MIAQAHSATLLGIEALPIVVEVDFKTLSDNNNFQLVGLPDSAVKESQVRVRSAVTNSEMGFPSRKIICNLAPGDIRKEGPFLDLPIAVAILAMDGQINAMELEGTLIIGELGLDGALRPVDGAVSVALMAHEKGFKRQVSRFSACAVFWSALNCSMARRAMRRNRLRKPKRRECRNTTWITPTSKASGMRSGRSRSRRQGATTS